MHKVYLLLRNNKQTGPHTLEELLQLAPKPNDLIWVEGRSAGWSYPSEIEALKPYVQDNIKGLDRKPDELSERQAAPATAANTFTPPPSTGKAVSKKVYVSLPVNAARPAAPTAAFAPVPESIQSLESRAEALRQRAQAYTPLVKEAEEAPLETKYARTLDDVEEDFTSWMVQKKTKRKTYPAKSIAIGIVGMALVGVGYILFTNTPVESGQLAAPSAVQASLPEATPETVTTVYAEGAPAAAGDKATDHTSLEQKENKNLAPKPQKGIAAAPANEKKEMAASNKLPAPTEATPPPNATAGTEQPQENNENETAATQDKKTIGQKIDGFFEKFKGRKKEEAAETTTAPAEGGERKSSRRDAAEAPAVPEVVNLLSQVEVTSSQPSQNWMMGIKDVKLTLRNRSEATVKDAAVEVLYYNEQKELLEKKVVRFSNVLPKKSKTIAAPDHRLADHTDYRLLSASGF